MKKLALFLMMAAMSAASVSAQPGSSKSSLLFSNASLPADARYELKSGIIKFEGVARGIKGEVTQYFDDYGKKLAAVSVVGQELEKKEVKIIQFEDTIYSIIEKIGLKRALPEKAINYLQLTPDVIEKYKIRDLGEETVAGKSCKKYSLEVTQMGQTVKTEVCVWKGIALKSVTKSGDNVESQTAIEILENATIDPKEFEIPEGVSFM